MLNVLDHINPMSLFTNEPNIDWTKSVEFLDAEFTIPLVSGLPLTLSVNGTAMVRLQAEGKVDVHDFFTTGDINIYGHIKPR